MGKEKVREIIAETLEADVSTLTADMNLVDDLHADSLRLVQILMAVEEEFNVELEDDDIMSVKTVGDIDSLVEKYIK